jgi:aspartyl aminopeptidase
VPARCSTILLAANSFRFHLCSANGHACVPAEAKRQLLDAGFKLLSESDDWDLQPGGRYFFTRNMSCLVAFAIGEKSVTHFLFTRALRVPLHMNGYHRTSRS